MNPFSYKYTKLGYAVLYSTSRRDVSNDNTVNSSVFCCFCGRGQSSKFVS